MSQGKSLGAMFLLAISSSLVRAQTPAQVELFEKNARPLFVGKCQGCHNAKLKSGGFDLSSPEGMKEAAASGIFGTSAEPEKSPILQALSYENRLKMPPQGKLPAETISAVREWVAAGAPIPISAADSSPSGTGLRPVATRGVITDADKNFWAFKPIQRVVPTATRRKDWAANPIDEFILANLWSGEFGRTPVSEGGNGRDHNPYGYSLFMAGGGVKPGFAYGVTDDFGYHAVENRMPIHDFHATVLALLGLDHTKLTYPYSGRDFRLTETAGVVHDGILG
jgi:hypothetical protein